MIDDAILFQELAGTSGRRIGRATINNPSAMNALTLDMLGLLYTQLRAWDAEPEIAAIVIDASGDTAFCAGGQLVALYESLTGRGDPDRPERFFALEYRLCHAIHRLATPCVVWGHGLIMGAGFGIFCGASHRVATGESQLSMPEIRIGLFPDCGATWFFNRLPDRIGLFLALSGATLNARDALVCGFADRAIDHAARADVLDAVTRIADWTQPHTAVDRVLRRFAGERPAALTQSRLLMHALTIREATDAVSLPDIVNGIRRLADSGDPWLAEAAANLEGGCPVTAHLIHRQLRDGRTLSLKQAVMREFKMALQCCRHPDFVEGVRALLVDKDRAPHWHFESVAAVPTEIIDTHFRAPWNGDHPLRDLPDVTP